MDSNQILLIILIVILVAGLVYIASKLNNSKKDDSGLEKSLQFLQNQLGNLTKEQNEKLDRTIKEMNDRLNDQNKTLTEQLGRTNQNVMAQFQMSQKSLKEYSDNLKVATQEITKVSETGNQIKSFATQLQSLEGILKNPKQRGVLGEYFLENVLKNVLPPKSFEMQYKFPNGEIVDAVVFVKDKIIPIDSKFSLENYNRIVESKDDIERAALEKTFKQDLKNRIDETSKYIRPELDTMSFAFMFIPSEGIYYDLLINQIGVVKTNTQDLIEYAFKKSVIIVSPTSFLAYLQTVLQGLRALQIEESVKQIIVQITKLEKDISGFEENFAKVGKHLSTTVGAYNSSFKNLGSMNKDFLKITGESLAISAEEVEKPQSEE